MFKLKSYHWITLILIFVLVVIGLDYIRLYNQRDQLYADLKNTEITLEEIKVVRAQNVSLSNALRSAKDTEGQLREQIASLRTNPAQVEFVYRAKTVLVPEEKEVIYEILPANHDYLLNGLTIAQFKADEKYHFITHDLSLRSQIVATDKKASIVIQGSSSADPNLWVELPVEATFQRIKPPRKNWEPNLLIGMSGSFPAAAHPSLTVTLWHPKDHIDALGIRAQPTSLSVGLDPIYYNVGKHLPIFTNIWVGGGATLNKDTTVVPTITIGGKL